MPRRDLTGQVYDKLTAVVPTGEISRYGAMWLCKCECGAEVTAAASRLTTGHVKSCKECKKKKMSLSAKAHIEAHGVHARIGINLIPKDITGERQGMLTAVSPTERKAGNGSAVWLCECDCGTKIEMPISEFRRGRRKSCGCAAYSSIREPVVGQVFGRLTAVKPTGRMMQYGKSRHMVWELKCECGNVIERPLCAVHGNTKSCGCLQSEIAAETGRRTIQKHIIYTDKTCINSIRSRKISSDNTTGVRGVSYSKKTGKWQAYICFRGKNTRLGYYDNLEDAAIARQRAESEIFDAYLEEYDASVAAGQDKQVDDGSAK